MGILVLASGCGGGGGGGETQPTTVSESEQLEALAEPPPKHASPLLKSIYREFQPPEPDPEVKVSAKAIKAGERECKNKTPLEVREEFIGESELNEAQEKVVNELERYEKNPSPSYPAGQLGALVYEKTLPEATANYGFQGCVYSLSLRVRRELEKP
jgi:hypothetical protein